MTEHTKASCVGSISGHRDRPWRAAVVLRLVAISCACLALGGCRPSDSSEAQHTTAQPAPAKQGSEPRAAPAPPAVERPAAPLASPPTGIPGRASDSEGPERPSRSDESVAARRAAIPVRPGAINDITFDDLEIDMPVHTQFDRSMLTPRAAQLDGLKVRLRGFIFAGSVLYGTGISEFLFVKNTECKFGPQGLAYCVIKVDLDEGVSTDFTTYAITVEGTLTVAPMDSDGFTWSVYHIQGQRVF